MSKVLKRKIIEGLPKVGSLQPEPKPAETQKRDNILTDQKIKGYKMSNASTKDLKKPIEISKRNESQATSTWVVIVVSILAFGLRLVLTQFFGEDVSSTIMEVVIYLLDAIFGIGIITAGYLSNRVKKVFKDDRGVYQYKP